MSSFTCPRCGIVSHNPTDVAEGYCGRCHDWTGDRPDEPAPPPEPEPEPEDDRPKRGTAPSHVDPDRRISTR